MRTLIGSLFKPREGELLYSVVARLKVRRGESHVRPLLRTLFDTGARIASPDLQAGVRELARFEEIFGNATPAELLRRHTLLPFFCASLPEERARTVEHRLLANYRGGVFAHLGIPASSVRAPTFLRLCADCVEAELGEIGEATWRRAHQCPGVYVCPQHGRVLVDTPVPVRSMSRHTFVHARASMLQQGRPAISGEYQHDSALLIARTIDRVLRGEISDLRKSTMAWLSKLPGKSPREKASRVGHEAIATFGAGYLERVGLLAGFENPTGWLRNAVYDPKRLTHSLRFVLMHLLASAEQARVGHPVARKRWPCPNVAARHPSRSTVRRIGSISTAESSGSKYECDACGFVFSSETDDRANRLIVRRVIRWGAFIEAEAKRLRGEGFGLRAAARELDMDPASVRRLWRAAESVDSLASPGTTPSVMRKRWVECLVSAGGTPTSARRAAADIYAWLYRRDREWLLATNAQYAQPRTARAPRVNWDTRDRDIAASIRVAAAELVSLEPPVRITRTALAKRINHYNRLEKWLDRLPITRTILLTVTESIEQFQARRLRFIAGTMAHLGTAPPAWALLRSAGIDPKRVTPAVAGVLAELCGD